MIQKDLIYVAILQKVDFKGTWRHGKKLSFITCNKNFTLSLYLMINRGFVISSSWK